MDCHYVSKFIVKRWANSANEVCLFDFIKKVRNFENYERIFSLPDIVSEDLEGWLNREVESILGGLLQDFEKNGIPDSKTVKSKTYRALWLYLMIQVPRINLAHGAKSVLPLLSSQPAQDLNLQIALFHRKYDLKTIHLPIGKEVFLNDHGTFLVPILCESEDENRTYNFCFCLPIAPTIVLMFVQRDLKNPDFGPLLETLLLQQWSIFSADVRSVIIPLRLASDFDANYLTEVLIMFHRANEDFVNENLNAIERMTGIKRRFSYWPNRKATRLGITLEKLKADQ